MNRRWTVLLPAIFVTYSLAYLDRANFGFGTAAGMAADLHISSAQSSLLASLFFLGYFLFQIPGVLYAQRHSVKRLIFAGLLGWGLPLAVEQDRYGLGPAAGSLAAIMGFTGQSAIPVILTCVVGLLLGLTGAWLASAARRFAVPA